MPYNSMVRWYGTGDSGVPWSMVSYSPSPGAGEEDLRTVIPNTRVFGFRIVPVLWNLLNGGGMNTALLVVSWESHSLNTRIHTDDDLSLMRNLSCGVWDRIHNKQNWKSGYGFML
jgi:hypothetical protein